MLLSPGVENERVRICLEKRVLPIALLCELPEILQVYDNIFSAMCTHMAERKGEGRVYAYRKDRMQSMEMVNAGSTFYFTSGSLANKIMGIG